MHVLPNVNLRQPVRLFVANLGNTATMPLFRVFFTNGREAKKDAFQLSPMPGPIPPNGTWRSTLTFLEVGVGSEPIDGQVQVTVEGDDNQVAVQYEYDEIVISVVRLNAVRV